LGNFCYFPTYTIGTAIASNIWEHTNSNNIINDDKIKNKDFNDLYVFLSDNIYKKGKLYTPTEILKPFADIEKIPENFVNYLKSTYFN
jgi:carboxypeptidase Taq